MKKEKMMIYVVVHGVFRNDDYQEHDMGYFVDITDAHKMLEEVANTYEQQVQWRKGDKLWNFNVKFHSYTERWWIDERKVF